MSSDSLVPLILIATLGVLVLVVAIIMFVVMYQRNMAGKERELKALRQSKQIDLFEASALAEERERERMARNLHDEINPMLAVLKYNLQKHRFDHQKNQLDPLQFEIDYSIIDKITDGIRSTSYELVPSFLSRYGLIASLKDHLVQLNASGVISTSLQAAHTESRIHELSGNTELQVYRICLELVNNIIKHTGSTAVNMSVQKNSGAVIITISHNGCGIDDNELQALIASGKGLGLRSLMARVILLNASIRYTKAQPLPSITLSVPLAA